MFLTGILYEFVYITLVFIFLFIANYGFYYDIIFLSLSVCLVVSCFNWPDYIVFIPKQVTYLNVIFLLINRLSPTEGDICQYRRRQYETAGN